MVNENNAERNEFRQLISSKRKNSDTAKLYLKLKKLDKTYLQL